MTDLFADLFADRIAARSADAIAALIARQASVVTAESCTGGLICSALTSVAGSSEVVYGGFITYANNAKVNMIGVSAETLHLHGAVSVETVGEMAKGALEKAGTTFAIAVTGVAGPGGGSAGKPVGLVWFGLSGPDGTHVEKRLFGDVGRAEVRAKTVLHALDLLIAATRR